MTINDIYNTRPKFYKILPSTGINKLNKIQIYQNDFLAELHPSGHKINDPLYYENIFKTVEKTDSKGNKYQQVVEIAESIYCYATDYSNKTSDALMR